MNKGRQLKYGKLPTKLSITNPWEALCVDLIGPYTLKGKAKTQIDFMCITMIDPATSWFEIVELPVSQLNELDIPMGAAIFGLNMLFDIPFIADWSKLGEYGQKQANRNTQRENDAHVDWDYQPGDQ
eukprot:CCRYP_019690-RA/>CCRYP_019690-RA protein AED:0.50 eAED:0.50 QI:0/0/0/1/0/0/2/0/126